MCDDISDDVVFPSSYRVYRRDRNRSGGGVAVLVKCALDATLLNQIDDHESLSLKVSFCGRSFLIFAVYRAPDSPPRFLHDLHEHMASYKHDRIFLVGDFNMPNVNWDSAFASVGQSPQTSYLLDIMMCHDLRQVVKQPTRVGMTCASVLDLVFVSQSIQNYYVCIENGLSDHHMVSFSCSVEKVCTVPRAKCIRVKNFSRAHDESVLDYLELRLSNFHGSNTAQMWDTFKNMCLHCIEHFVPDKVKKTRKLTPWISRDILHLKRKLKRLKRGVSSRDIIQTTQLALNQAVASAKRSYFEHELPNFIRSAPQKFWNFLSNKRKPIEKLRHDNALLVDKTDIAEHFNAYFYGLFSTVHEPMPQIVSNCRINADIVSISGVISMMLNLKTKSSPGPDGIPNVFLSRYAEALSPFLVAIFNTSLSSGVLPFDWKVGRIVPVFKKGDVMVPGNYRPISLTSSCCKILEHIIANYISKFLNDNGLLSCFQHGFRKGFSTVTQLTSIVHSFAGVLDKTGQVDVIFLDFRKAFDLVPHSQLMLKLQAIGLPAFITNWISSYLSDRTQYVSIDDKCSKSLPVTSGVPQGSVLGPLLFLIYINDIVDVITSPVQIRLFADDCILFNEITCHEDQIQLNSNLLSIQAWCTKWNMKLNAEKSVFMKITKKKNSLSFSYELPERPLCEVSCYKYLGVTITNNLSWNQHVSNVCASSFRKLCLLRHKLKLAPPSVKLLAYTSIIRPKLEYACSVWDPHKQKNIQALEMIQRKAVRFIYSKYRLSDSPTTLMKEHGIQTLQARRKIERLKFLYQLKSNKLGISPDQFIQPLTSRRTRHRHAASLTPYSARTNVFKFSFYPRTISDWNDLPISVVCSIDGIEHIEN